MQHFGRWRRSRHHRDPAADASGSQHRWSIIFIVLACLLLLGLHSWIEWNALNKQEQETAASLVNLASSLTQHAEDTIEIASTAVGGLVERLETDGTSPAVLAQIDRKLMAQIAAGAHRYSVITALDPDGNWLATSLPTKGANSTDRSYFQHHRDNLDRATFVGPPIRSRVTGQWVITVSRRFRSANGGFAGVVVAMIELSSFVDHYATYNLGLQSSITLAMTDGTLLARYPSREEFIGRNIPSATLFSKLHEHPAGSFLTTTILDGVRRFVGYRRGDRYPLVVADAMSEDQALEAWYAQMMLDMAIALVLVGVVGLLGLRLVNQIRHSETADQKVRQSEARYRSQADNLREANERVNLATDSGSIGLWDWDVTQDTMIWNSWMYRLRGMQRFDETPSYALWQRHLHPDDRAVAEQAVQHSLKSMQLYHQEYRVVWDDGSIRHIRGSGRMTRDAAGNVIRIIGANWDITNERIEQEQRTIIIEAAPTGMMIIDEVGFITLANTQVGRIFDYPDGALVGQSIEILVPESVRGTHEALRSAFTSGRSDQAMAPERIFIGRKRDGSSVTIEIMLRPVRTPRGNIVVASLFDVSERVRLAAEREDAETKERLAAITANRLLDRLSRHLAEARDRAEQANQAKSRFLAGMSHELRTPLHGILGYAELLSLEGGLSPTQSEYVTVMMAAGQHLLDMINAVLDLSQIEADQIVLQPVEVALPDLVRACLDVVRPSAEAKGLTLFLAPAEPLRLFADATRLRQVLINLLGNAIKFTPTGSVEVRLRLVEAQSCIRLEVADTGPGVWLRHRDKLFQTFERLNADAVSGVEGAGLGLAIAARLVQLMGGQIGYLDNPGGGSVFWFELPAQAMTTVAETAANTRATAASSPHLRVLVVDDEALNRNIASRFLTNAGHEVVCVDNGAAALEAAEAGDFDLILMDVRMPVMDGMEATRRIRMLPGPRGQVRVVAVTAQAFAQQIEMCRQAGMNSHISKPFNKAVLLAAVETIDAASGSPSMPTASTIDEAELAFPEFDRTMLEDATEFMPAEQVEEHLQVLLARCEALLARLRKPGMVARELIEDAHKLAGGAGTFGLLSVAAAARQFEVAADTGAAGTLADADHLVSAIEVSITIIRNELFEAVASRHEHAARNLNEG